MLKYFILMSIISISFLGLLSCITTNITIRALGWGFIRKTHNNLISRSVSVSDKRPFFIQIKSHHRSWTGWGWDPFSAL